MSRTIVRTLAAVTLLVAGSAAGHPGHDTPHLLHEADAGLVWVVLTAVCAGAAAWAFARRRS